MLSRFFDHVYLVNLQQHRGRKLRALEHLGKFGIYPEVFEATDGYISPSIHKYKEYSEQDPGSLVYFSKFNSIEKKRGKRFIESAGAYGYIDTYIRILEEAKQKNYHSILIFEDDVLLTLDFNNNLEALLSNLPENWKFINLGSSQYGWNSVDLERATMKGFYRPKQLDTCGSFAIAINKSVYDELIQLQNHFEAPFDHLPLGEIYNRYPNECFVAYPNIVMPDVRSSSIRGSRNQLTHAKKMKWNPQLFEYPPKRLIINLIITSKEQIKYLKSFNDENTFPFELHLFIPSLDGLRPFHNILQKIELTDKRNVIVSPNSGLCIRSVTNKPITEEDLIEFYKSIISNNLPTKEFEVIDSQAHEIDSERVSVIIPTYKRSESLARVLASVIEQDYKNKEIIIVDDNQLGSAEQLETKRVVLSVVKENPSTNIIYISQTQSRNGAGARNTGFLKSRGNYICFLDDDDLYLPGRLSKSIEKLKNTPRFIGAVYCGFEGWNGAAQVSRRYDKNNLTLELLSLDYLSHYLHTNTATYKRDAVISINGFDETFLRHQDLEFNLRFFEYYNMVSVQEKLVYLRPNPTNINNQQFGIKLFKTKLKFLNKFQYIINRYDFFTQKIIYDKHWEEVVNYIPDDEVLFDKFLSSNISNGYLQCFMRLKQTTQDKKKITQNSNDIESIIEFEKELFVSPKNENLNFWQIKGASAYGIVFSKFILPQQRHKLQKRPKAFFEDSKHGFTRFVGKLLRFI